MGAKDREILLDEMLDRALALYANSPVPPGLEKRILARLERRKARSRKRIEAACIVAAAALSVMPVLLRVHSGNPVKPVVAAHYTPAADWTPREERHPRLDYTLVDAARPAPRIEERARKSTMIAEFHIEPVRISELRISSLSDSQ
jgi:hypothetical protein